MTRRFAVLESHAWDAGAGLLTLQGAPDDLAHPEITLRREGIYALIAVSVGVLEIALRLHHDELRRALHNLQANDGLTTTRQIGTAQAYLGIGLKTDQSLILRPVIVGDATGHLRLNLRLNSQVRETFQKWIEGSL